MAFLSAHTISALTYYPYCQHQNPNFSLLSAHSFFRRQSCGRFGDRQKIEAQIVNSASKRQLQRLRLQCYQRLQLHQQSILLATELIESNRWQPNSGLAYWILANAHYKQGTYDLALRTALEAIVLDTRPYGTYLNSCYALAVLSALKLKQLEYAQNLYREMQDSHLEWPQKPSALAKLEKTLIQNITTDHALP